MQIMQNEHPLVTIIVPCFNQSQFLKRCLDSILTQGLSRSELQIIVLDDGSDQKSCVEQLQKLQSHYQFDLVRTKNQGLASTRNEGLQRAKGLYTQFLDADDYLLPQKLKIQTELFKANEKLDVCICDYWIENRWKGNWLQSIGTTTRLTKPYQDLLFRWETEISIPIHCALFKTQSLGQIRFPAGLRAKEDWIFWLRLAQKNLNFACTAERLAIYVLHGQNMTKNPESILASFLEAVQLIETEFCISTNEKSLFLKHISNVLSQGYLPRLKNSYLRRIQVFSALQYRWIFFRDGLSTKFKKHIKTIAWVAPLPLLILGLWLFL
jgi:glycosyltransferase involved in cell wall biosynthesis